MLRTIGSSDDGFSIPKRAAAALLAGGVAIGLNTAALAVADLIPLATAHGGLLRLLNLTAGSRFSLPTNAGFQAEFHVLVGLAMALFYAFLLEPILPGPGWVRGLIYAGLTWIANAAAVLPLIGEGFAGRNHLTLPGIIWFAAAHIVFFIVMAVLYERLRYWAGWHPRAPHAHRTPV